MATGAPAAAAPSLTIKWDHFGQIRRFAIPLTEGDVYATLMEKIRALRPDFQGGLAWNDEEGDLIFLSSTDELKEAIALKKDGQLLKVFSVEDIEKEGDHEVVLIDNDDEDDVNNEDEPEEQEDSGNESVQFVGHFMPRRLRRGRSRSRSHSRRSSRSRSRSASCDYSSDDSEVCRKMRKRMAKASKKGYKKEMKLRMKMMRHHGGPFAMGFKSGCPRMEKRFPHHPFHVKMAKKHAMRRHPMKHHMPKRGLHPFFSVGRHHPWMPHDRRGPPPTMMPHDPSFRMPPPPPPPEMGPGPHPIPPPFFPMHHHLGAPHRGRKHCHRRMPPPPPFPMDHHGMYGPGIGIGPFGMGDRRHHFPGF